MPTDDALLKEIRERFQYALDTWKEIRSEAATDMKFVTGDPWDEEERRRREDTKRPILALDELNQYVQQVVNDVRQNKRSIRPIPKGSGANDKDAEFIASLIRQIEYKSNAQSAYATAFQDAVERSYGYFKITWQYCNGATFDRELKIQRILNPDSVLLDPDAREADYSDMGYAFVIDSIKKSAFRRLWPEARITSFTDEIATAAPGWITEQNVQLAEYWRIEREDSAIYQFADRNGTIQEPLGEAEFPAGSRFDKVAGRLDLVDGTSLTVAASRTLRKPKVVQYITNGVEVLDTREWPGRYIPIIPVMGKEMFVDRGRGSERLLFSLVRLARDPYKLYCFYRTCQAEVVGMTPKTPFIGYDGQFEGHEQEWQNVSRLPLPYLTVKPTVQGAPANVVLPPPQRQVYEPPIQALELGAESARRGIMAAMGKYNVSVGRDDTRAKSGVAIRELDQQSDQGSFHFIDNYNRALEHAGRVILELLPVFYGGGPRDAGVRMPDDTYRVVRMNDPANPEGEVRCDRGEWDVTIATGPSYQSQREEASVYADLLSQIEGVFPRIADLVVKMKNLGPIGDEIAKRLTPPDVAEQKAQGIELPPGVQAAMEAQAKELMALKELLTKLMTERQAKILELESKESIAALQETTKLTINEMKVNFERSQAMLEAELQAISEQVKMLTQPPAPVGEVQV